MTYIVRGVDPEPYRPLFGLSDEQLSERQVVRMLVTEKPNFPCRVTLEDREPGETVLLCNHVSNDVANPYRASHAIFILEGASKRAEFIDRTPPVFGARVLSLRGFDANGMMVDAELAAPGAADSVIRRLLANRSIETIHAHNATRGCFSAMIERD